MKIKFSLYYTFYEYLFWKFFNIKDYKSHLWGKSKWQFSNKNICKWHIVFHLFFCSNIKFYDARINVFFLIKFQKSLWVKNTLIHKIVPAPAAILYNCPALGLFLNNKKKYFDSNNEHEKKQMTFPIYITEIFHVYLEN